MRVILHGVTNDIRNFVVAPVLQFPHRMQNPSLHRLKPVIGMRNRSFENYIRCIIKKPVPVHVIDINSFVVLPFLSRSLSQSFRVKSTHRSLFFHYFNLLGFGVFFGFFLFVRHPCS